jgi:ligand-binding sensor domain-containing protein
MYKHFITTILLLYALSGFAQNQSLKFEHIGTSEGLSQINVATIIQDSRGFMWIGTRDGLNKYDGYSFTTYRHDSQDPQSITSSMVADMAEDKDGNIWVATIIGLNKIDRKTGHVIQYKHDDKNPNSLSNNILNKLAVDDKNNIWIAGQGGLDYLDTHNNTFKHYRHIYNDAGSLSDNNISFVYITADKNVWAGTFAGACSSLKKTPARLKSINTICRTPKVSPAMVSVVFLRTASTAYGWALKMQGLIYLILLIKGLSAISIVMALRIASVVIIFTV